MSTPVSRRQALATLASFAIGGPALGAPGLLARRYRLFGRSSRDYSARAVRLVEENVVVDMLDQFRFPDFSEKPVKADAWLRAPRSMSRADFEQYRTSGIRVFALGHAMPDYESAIRFFAGWNSFIAAYDDWFIRVDDTGDFDRTKATGEVGIMLTFQNSDHFRSPADVTTFFGLGQRVSQLTYNFTNR